MKLRITQVYDTQTATIVDEIAYEGASRLHSIVETLYRSPNGDLFLHGKGGALTKYARHRSDSITSGERITPMTEHEAECWQCWREIFEATSMNLIENA